MRKKLQRRDEANRVIKSETEKIMKQQNIEGTKSKENQTRWLPQLTNFFSCWMMATCAHTAASLSPDSSTFSYSQSCKSQCICTSLSCLNVLNCKYSSKFLLDIRVFLFQNINDELKEELQACGLLRKPASPPAPTPSSPPE